MEKECGSRSRYWDNKNCCHDRQEKNMVSWRFGSRKSKSLGVARSGNNITQTIQSIQQAIQEAKIIQVIK
jgi:hypothetical protein